MAECVLGCTWMKQGPDVRRVTKDSLVGGAQVLHMGFNAAKRAGQGPRSARLHDARSSRACLMTVQENALLTALRAQ